MTTKARWRDLTLNEKLAFGNGCGPAFFPEWLTVLLFGWFFDASCRRHDFGYARGGSRADRKAVDVGFYQAMLRDAARFGERSKLKQQGLRGVAWAFYALVRGFGWVRFNYGPYLSYAELVGIEAVG